ncbi:MAG: hypothetical protein JXJ22_04600 [Bacteroidales bacterium]|nr:hypothetical protein [Bacteroidales bacterium]
MKRTISILAIIWAFFCTFIILIIFIKGPQFTRLFGKLPSMIISPVYAGGDLNYVVEGDSLKIAVNKPVFEALIGESAKGFVQITFSGTGNLPQLIEQEIDYDKDLKPDFKLKINTIENKTEYLSISPNAGPLIVSSKVHDDWVVRIKVRNKKK